MKGLFKASHGYPRLNFKVSSAEARHANRRPWASKLLNCCPNGAEPGHDAASNSGRCCRRGHLVPHLCIASHYHVFDTNHARALFGMHATSEPIPDRLHTCIYFPSGVVYDGGPALMPPDPSRAVTHLHVRLGSVRFGPTMASRRIRKDSPTSCSTVSSLRAFQTQDSRLLRPARKWTQHMDASYNNIRGISHRKQIISIRMYQCSLATTRHPALTMQLRDLRRWFWSRR